MVIGTVNESDLWNSNAKMIDVSLRIYYNNSQ